MTSEQQIQQQLNNEYDKFINKKYEGKVMPPENILDLFERAILAMPPFAHKINFHRVKAIFTTDYKELTNSNLNDIIKVVLNISLERLYPEYDFMQIIDRQIKMDKFVMAYNNHIEEFKKSLEMKKATLESLSGVRKNGNGMRIIPQA